MYRVTGSSMQLSFEEQVNHIGSLTDSAPVKFLNLLVQHFDIKSFIPQSFYKKYYASSTNDRDISLESILNMLILIHFFKFDTFSTFIVLLSFAPDIRSFCKLKINQLPTESTITKFKTSFDGELLNFFNQISSHVIDICAKYNDTLPDDSPDKNLNETAIYDTSGVKPKVKENNPKFTASEIKKQETYKKFLQSKGQSKDFNVYSAAYANLPKFAEANNDIRLDFVNGHFGYFYKFGTINNGFGIPLHLNFFDSEFYDSLPSNFTSMEEQKYSYDNASLKPVFSSFLNRIGSNPFNTFLGDSEFDSYDNYGFLNQIGFNKVLIPVNPRNSNPDRQVEFPINDEGVPCCPKDGLPFIADGSCKGKNRSLRLKYVCPLSVKNKCKWTCTCENKCRNTNSTVTKYSYPASDLRVYSGVQRGSDEWCKLYKKRSVIERSLSSLKSHPALDKPNTYNCATLRSDICLAAISKLITVMLAFAVNNHSCMRNLKLLVKKSA